MDAYTNRRKFVVQQKHLRVHSNSHSGQAVLYLNTPTYLGGAERSLLSLISHLEAGRFCGELVTSGDGLLAQAGKALGITVFQQEFPLISRRRPWPYLVSILKLAQIIRRRRIAIVHTNCDNSLPFVRHACRLTRTPYVSHVRDFARDWFGPGRGGTLRDAKYVIANSQSIAQTCRDAGVSEEKIRVVYNPIDVDAFIDVSPAKEACVRQEFGITNEDCVVGIVGQIQDIKGHDEYVTAAAKVTQQLRQVRFLIVGSSMTIETKAFEEKLRQKINRHGLQEYIHFTGFREDIPALMKVIDILTVPSWNEAFGRVVVEGLASGCAVIATDNGGIPEIIQDGVNGLLIPPRNPISLSEAILKVAGDSKLRARLIANGPTTAAHYSPERHVREIEHIYDEALD